MLFCLCLVIELSFFQSIVVVYGRTLDDQGTRYASVVLDANTKSLVLIPKIVEPNVAHASFENTYNKTGWSLLKVTTNGSYDDNLQAEAAGRLEGYLTAELISMQYQNIFHSFCGNKEFCDKLNKFLTENTIWLQQQIKNNPDISYWYQVSLIFKQLEGLQIGYNHSLMKPELTLRQLLILQLGGDIGDLQTVLSGGRKKKPAIKLGHCSALIKVLPGHEDILISHDTWNEYSYMLRIYKLYNLSLHEYPKGKVVPGGVQSFPSYPSMLLSVDDFYIIGSGLVSQETSLDNLNEDLWKYVTPRTLLDWVRVNIANRLATTGEEWCSIYKQHNSGTYNNQWMVFDYKRFEIGRPLKPGTLWILEQLPGYVAMEDKTDVLEKQGYWASYNLPYFATIYNMSDTPAAKKMYGDWFDYELNPRAQIFKRDHVKVKDMESFMQLMRYNDFKHDPLSKCNCTPPYSALNAISARGDLNPANGTYPFGILGHSQEGAYDCKATSFKLAMDLSQYIVCGPTDDQQPPFQWSKTEWKRPLGQPDIFRFEPFILQWN